MALSNLVKTFSSFDFKHKVFIKYIPGITHLSIKMYSYNKAGYKFSLNTTEASQTLICLYCWSYYLWSILSLLVFMYIFYELSNFFVKALQKNNKKWEYYYTKNMVKLFIFSIRFNYFLDLSLLITQYYATSAYNLWKTIFRNI